MSRRRHGRMINGWLILDKPVGLTSNAAAQRVRRSLQAAKAGHGGALDPLASGILPVAFGEATKTVPFIMEGFKSYDFTVRWGEARDSDDAQGEIIETSEIRPSKTDIRSHLSAFIGMTEQIPPRVSAIKINGRRAYQLARTGQDIALAPRPVMIKHVALIDCPDGDHARFHLVCGKGCYVRSLARDLARCLGTVGHVTALRRTRVGPFGVADALSLDWFESLRHKGEEHLLPVESVLDSVPVVSVDPAQAVLLRHGQALATFRLAAYRSQKPDFGDASPKYTGPGPVNRQAKNDFDKNDNDCGTIDKVSGIGPDSPANHRYINRPSTGNLLDESCDAARNDHAVHTNKAHDDLLGGILAKDRLYGDVRPENVRVVMCQGRLVALAHITQGFLRPVRVFHLESFLS